MKLTFQIDYHTAWGESMYIIGSLPCISEGVKMDYDGEGKHSLSVEASPAIAEFNYRYELRRDNGSVRKEWGPERRLRTNSHLQSALIVDSWKDIPSNKPFFASAFTECIFRHDEQKTLPEITPGTVTLRVDAPAVPDDCRLVMSGNCEQLGNWNPANAPGLLPLGHGQWSISLPLMLLPEQTEFKFVVIQPDGPTFAAWETTDNRTLLRPHFTDNGSLVVTGLFFESPLPLWRGAGTAIPVFSLRSAEGFGVGEFPDIMKMVDWAVMTGQQFIQLLPINDTTMTHSWTDSYPYTTNSTFALHPMYLRISDVGQLTDVESAEYSRQQAELNALPVLDYEKVNRAKQKFLHILFTRQGMAEMTSQEFKSFAKENDFWLLPYAAWCVLRDRFRTPDMDQWGEYSTYSQEKVNRFIDENRSEIDFVRFVQYHLDKQLRHARNYAASKGVAIKGDIPIGISRCSVDAWMWPHLFNLDCTAGAPPDDFATHGQNWGFPTYRWDVMARDNYSWWKARLGKMAQYFSAYRIDHLLGFFRIWQIPTDTFHGILGVFCPALPLSPAELQQKWQFKFHKELYTRPFITDRLIDERFGEQATKARNLYLDLIAPGHYALRKEFSSQLAIFRHFEKLEDSEANNKLRDCLMDLLDEVLFIEDPYKPDTYHPRIEGQKTETFKTLDEEQQQAFNLLYEDFFYHRHNDFWREKALEKLPALIDSTGMLSCAEDLGMIPACVPSVMDMLQILSLEIQRMPKEFGVPFGIPSHYPYLSVCSTSTHDMPGLRQWWEEDYERASRFYREMLGATDQAPRSATPEICHAILRMNLKSPSMLCILPLQDWLSIDSDLRRPDPSEEQINVPANPRHYWRYRMHLNLEQLLDASEFNSRVRQLVSCR